VVTPPPAQKKTFLVPQPAVRRATELRIDTVLPEASVSAKAAEQPVLQLSLPAPPRPQLATVTVSNNPAPAPVNPRMKGFAFVESTAANTVVARVSKSPEFGAVESPAPPPTEPTTSRRGSFEAATIAGEVAPLSSTNARTRGVQIEFKPKPLYTDEARGARIQGEVIVEVRFETSGKAQPLRVITGLGYGLDENALQAAAQIQFRPAERNGKPVDQTALVHFVYQLTF
jgi:TonB family protein